ncbi:signal peptidase I [Aureitalea sp. L0-47]|uniref:signal peptidase I n=1 Tax=Aureitalea sp. L0-47 TaxID=2816962 RepID=UPI002236FB8C|nr:signal peptidase I [Aureitalea sp. L0-47]MCW5520999.1 signal peptidase I [Aureitalea sp. L0-47]
MNIKSKILIFSGLAFIIVLVVFYHFQHFFRQYHIPTNSNEPALPVNSTIWASSFKDYDRYDFVIFEQSDTTYYVFRLIGLPGETITFKNDVTYVNGRNVDSLLTLKHAYLVDRSEIENPQYGYNISHFPINDSTYVKFMIDSIALKRNYKKWKNPSDLNKIDQTIKLGDDEIYVMGDNRDNAMDSREIGPVKTNKIVSVVLNKR